MTGDFAVNTIQPVCLIENVFVNSISQGRKVMKYEDISYLEINLNIEEI